MAQLVSLPQKPKIVYQNYRVISLQPQVKYQYSEHYPNSLHIQHKTCFDPIQIRQKGIFIPWYRDNSSFINPIVYDLDFGLWDTLGHNIAFEILRDDDDPVGIPIGKIFNHPTDFPQCPTFFAMPVPTKESGKMS